MKYILGLTIFIIIIFLILNKPFNPQAQLKQPDQASPKTFSENLVNPRDLVFSPGGTLLVSSPQSGQVLALPSKKVIIEGTNHVHGLAFYGDKLYIAEVNRIARYNWDEKILKASFDKELFTLPDNNNHNNRTIAFDKTGKMYVSVGSTCNVCVEKSEWSGTIIVSDWDGNNPRVFARGLRNAPFMAINPKTGELWATEMGRDFLGDNLPPDEINIIKDGKDYGWPYCYGNKIQDASFGKSTTGTCQKTEAPIYEIPAHSAPLGLVFVNENELLVAYHGSWNRSVPTGYKIVRMKLEGNKITKAEDILKIGRPVDMVFDKSGNLYISDDREGKIYIVQKK